MSITISKPNPNETLSEYIKRLIDSKEITPTQIPLAVSQFNKK